MDGTFTDPVCGMEVSRETAQATSEYDSKSYYFCSMDCKDAFDEDPEQYVSEEENA